MEWWIMIYRFLSVLFHLFSVIVWLYGIYFCHSWAFKGVFWKKRGKKAMTLTSKLTYTAPVIYSKTRAFFSIFLHLYILLCPSDSAATVNNRTLWGNLFFPTSFWIFLFDFFDRVESFAFKCQSKCAPQWMTKTTIGCRQPLTSRFPIRFTQHSRRCVGKPHISRKRKKKKHNQVCNQLSWQTHNHFKYAVHTLTRSLPSGIWSKPCNEI